MLLTGELLQQCKNLIEEGVHPHAVVRAFRKATTLAVDKINECAVKVNLMFLCWILCLGNFELVFCCCLLEALLNEWIFSLFLLTWFFFLYN